MQYTQMKARLLDLFGCEKLLASNDEWGFYHEEERDMQKIGYATNLTVDVIEKARKLEVDLILTHHDSWEFVFGLKEQCDKLLDQYRMTHAFFHAPLDDADFGTSASLADAIGMQEREKAVSFGDTFLVGVIGRIEPVGFDTFIEQLSAILQEPVRRFQNNDQMVEKICVVTGGGNMTGEMKVAVDHGCDTYITGEYVLYSQQYAQLTGMNLLIGSHTNTEILGVQSLAGKLIQGTDLKMIKIEEPSY